MQVGISFSFFSTGGAISCNIKSMINYSKVILPADLFFNFSNFFFIKFNYLPAINTPHMAVMPVTIYVFIMHVAVLQPHLPYKSAFHYQGDISVDRCL